MFSFLNKFNTRNSRLESLSESIASNMANNYKDAAQEDFQAFKTTLQDLTKDGKLNEKQRIYYESILHRLEGQLNGYTHKDQKPYWSEK